MRRQYIVKLHQHTGRNVVTYYTDYMSGAGGDVSIVLGDVHGLMEVFKDLPKNDGLDLILHSPGGDPTAADSLVRYMRAKFDDVRVIVPVAAMSAATMWALSANSIVMGRQSQLGPIDPQLVTAQGMVPSGAITRTFERAQKECAQDPTRLSGWVPTLQQYFPGLLEMCDDSTRLARTLAEEYLRDNMFKDVGGGGDLARVAAEYFANDQVHIAHGRGIHRDQVEHLSLAVEPLEADGELQDRVLSVHHAYMHTFALTAATKVIENHLGRALVRTQMVQQMPFLMAPQPTPPGFPPGQP
ncbi:SDH family Clp fold serine proteinase [Microbacterium testaceum]|uniref:SDH family Clp fold serine proteinase n=1 Tax=Microbacterium testaceum TaxID=2033 RepID=UPI000AB7B828|nr:serine protease [Microbacterium testaceum]